MFIREFLEALLLYPKSLAFISKNNLWKFTWLPGLLSLLIIIGLIVLGITYSDSLSIFILEYFKATDNSFLYWTLIFLVWIVLIILGLILYKPVVLIIAAPLLANLSEKTERILNIPLTKNANTGVFRDISRSIHINIYYLISSLLYSVLIFLISFLPLIGAIFSSVGLFLVQGYYSGCGLADVILERHGFTVRERKTFVKNNKAVMMGNGSGFLLLLLIPVVGWFFAPAIATVASTLTLVKKLK